MIHTLPPLPFNPLQAMRIMDEVKMKLAGKENLLATSIKNSKLPDVATIKTIQSAATDNYNMVADQIGCKLTDEILKFK
jgi:hypothetical protein